MVRRRACWAPVVMLCLFDSAAAAAAARQEVAAAEEADVGQGTVGVRQAQHTCLTVMTCRSATCMVSCCCFLAHAWQDLALSTQARPSLLDLTAYQLPQSLQQYNSDSAASMESVRMATTPFPKGEGGLHPPKNPASSLHWRTIWISHDDSTPLTCQPHQG